MKVWVVVDLTYGDEGNPGIKVFSEPDKAVDVVERLQLANAVEIAFGDYLLVGPEEVEVDAE